MPYRYRLIVLLLLVLVPAGCRARPTPMPSPTPSVTTAPTATRAPAATRAQATPAALPAGWQEHRGADFTLYLPPGWQVLAFSEGEAESRMAQLQNEDPLLAGFIGDAASLQEAELWAFGPAAAGATFVDNLNIRRTPLAGQSITDMAALAAPIVEQYRRLNFTDVSAQPDLSIGSRPAAHITYRFSISPGEDVAAPAEVNGHQYLVATDTDLWILSFAAGPDSAADTVERFARSAQSFATR